MFDRKTGVLKHSVDGRKQQLDPQQIRLLILFIDRAGETLGKEVIIQHVWQQTAVSDDAVFKAVSRLRKILAPGTYIRTNNRLGYIFVADIKGSDASFESGKLHLKLPFKMTTVSAAAATIVISLVVLVLLPNISTDNGVLDIHSTHQLTSTRDANTHAALSPEASHVAFRRADQTQGAGHIYIQHIGLGNEQQLTYGQVDDYAPQWSDSSQLLFMRKSEDECTIYQMLIGLESLTPVTSCVGNSYPDLAISKDGVQLAYSSSEETKPQSIKVYDRSTGKLKSLTQPPSNSWGDFNPVFSHDGTQLYFIRAYSEGVQEIFSISRDGAEEKQLSSEDGAVFGIEVDASGGLYIASSFNGGLMHLRYLPEDMKTPILIDSSPQHKIRPSLAETNGETFLAFENYSQTSHLWQINYTAASVVPAAEFQQLTTSNKWDMHPAVSPDGQHLAFVSNRSGRYAIWSKPIGLADSVPKSANRLSAEIDGLPSDLVWSADSRYLIYSVRGGKDAGIYRLDNHFSTPPEVLVRDNFPNLFPEIGADGTLYFSTNRAGDWYIYRLDTNAGGIEKIEGLKGYRAVPSNDGLYLYVTSFHGGGIRRYDLATGAVRDLNISVQSGDWANWGVTKNNSIYFIEREKAVAYLKLHNLATGYVEVVAEFPSRKIPFNERAVTVQNENNSFIVGLVDRIQSDILLHRMQ